MQKSQTDSQTHKLTNSHTLSFVKTIISFGALDSALWSCMVLLGNLGKRVIKERGKIVIAGNLETWKNREDWENRSFLTKRERRDI